VSSPAEEEAAITPGTSNPTILEKMEPAAAQGKEEVPPSPPHVAKKRRTSVKRKAPGIQIADTPVSTLPEYFILPGFSLFSEFSFSPVSHSCWG
jgi:hypothetical protein